MNLNPAGKSGRAVRRVAVLIMAGVLAGCASAPMKMERAGGAEIARTREKQGTVVSVRIDTGDRPLGAYTVVLRYDPEAARVLDVEAPGPGGFPGAPMADPATFDTGATPIVGFHVGRAHPRGRVEIARVLLEPRGGGSAGLSVSVRSLYGPGGKPVPGTADVIPPAVKR